MEIDGITFDINRLFKACVCEDEFTKQCINVTDTLYLELINKLAPGWQKYTITKDIISDAEIHQFKREIIEELNQIKKEISNANNFQFRVSFFEIHELRKALMGYLIKAENGMADAKIQNFRKLDAEIQKLGKHQMDLI